LGPIAPVLAATEEGNDVEIPRGKVLTAFVHGDVPVTAPAPAVQEVAAGTTANDAAWTQVDISSTPAGADIEVDGKFWGNTPSSITLATGTHKVRVLKRGYRAWTRTVTTAGGDVRLSAQLVRSTPSKGK
jgi:cytoskeletal protein RodZ